MALSEAEIEVLQKLVVERNSGGMLLTTETAADLDIFYVLLCGYLIFFMQGGFAMLSVGAVRSKNAKNIILYILLDATFGAMGWYFFGYAFAYGDKLDANGENDGNAFIGTKYFALSDSENYTEWFFQYTFAATAATIVSGSVIERASIQAYITYSFFLTAFVYPVVAHWAWAGSGWLSSGRTTGGRLFDTGMIDFAGCGPVHMVGGISGLVGSAFLGPRLGRYTTDGRSIPLPGHSVPLAALGTFMLWFGWYGFNGGSTLAIIGQANVAAKVAVSTTLGGAGGAVSALAFSVLKDKVWDVSLALNGALAGLVSITSGCAVMQPWAALLSGLIGGVLFPVFSRTLTRFHIDDPLEAAAMHGGCGMWGLIATGLFAETKAMRNVYSAEHAVGVFYGDGKLLGAQVVAILAIFSWVAVNMSACFFFLKLAGHLRVSMDDEIAGLDASKHGGSAYEDFVMEKGSGVKINTEIAADGSTHGVPLYAAAQGVGQAVPAAAKV